MASFQLLQRTKAQIAQLEAEIRAELPRELAELPARYGFQSAQAFIRAVKTAAAGRSRRKRRRVLTPRQRAKLATDLKDGMPYPKAVKKYRVSSSTVYNVKKAVGLV